MNKKKMKELKLHSDSLIEFFDTVGSVNINSLESDITNSHYGKVSKSKDDWGRPILSSQKLKEMTQELYKSKQKK